MGVGDRAGAGVGVWVAVGDGVAVGVAVAVAREAVSDGTAPYTADSRRTEKPSPAASKQDQGMRRLFAHTSLNQFDKSSSESLTAIEQFFVGGIEIHLQAFSKGKILGIVRHHLFQFSSPNERLLVQVGIW